MQPRILIKEEGQKKKRFISPTEIKNNQLVYGDAIGSSKIININPPISQRVYSPSSESQKSITQIEKQQMQSKIKTIEVHKNIENNNLNDSKLSSDVSKQSSTKRLQRLQKVENNHQTSRSKSGKKDFMMTQLSKLNNKKSSKNYETQSNSSQSRSKIGSIRSNDKNKNILQSEKDEEYSTVKRNVYNQKQTLKQRERISNSIELQIRRFDKRQQQGNGVNSVEQSKAVVKKPSIHLSQVRPESEVKKFNQQEKRSPRSNFHKPPMQKTSIMSNQQQQSLVKPSVVEAKQSYQLNRPQKIQDPQNSTLAVHLKKAHEQKEQLRQKKIQAQRERNECKQRLESQQQQLINLRKQLEYFQVQNLSLTSELKSIRQAQVLTKSQLQDTNARNQHLYRQLHEKYTSIMKEYKKSISSNEQLKQQIENQKVQNLNLLKRNQFNQQRIKQLQENIQIQQNQHIEMIEKITVQCMEKYQKAQMKLRKYKQQQIGHQGIQSSKEKLKQLQNENQQKTLIISKKDQQINTLKKDFQVKVNNMQKLLFQKQKQITQINVQLKKQQNLFKQKLLQNQKNIKDLQLIIAEKQKEIQLKKIEISQNQSKNHQSMLKSQIQNIYSTNMTSSQTSEAKSTIEHIVSSQTQEVNFYKKSLNEKIEENFNLQSQVQQLRSMNNNTKQELQIIKLQYSALLKKQDQSSSTQLYIIKNQLEVASRRQKQLQRKLEMKTNEIKEKQQFIQSFLSNKSK